MQTVAPSWLRFGCAEVKLDASARCNAAPTSQQQPQHRARCALTGMTEIHTVAADTIEVTTPRKVRARIIPLVFVLFVIAVLDRNNIGFAALTMKKELGIISQQYGFIAGVFFIGYFIF